MSRRSSSSSPRKSSSSSSGEKHKRRKKYDHPPFRHMITEAIYQDKKWSKGSNRVDIRKFIEKNYDVDGKSLTTELASNLVKMQEKGSNDYACLIPSGDDNFKLTPEWRKEWKTRNGIKSVKRKKVKDKNAPKGARNAYIYYMLDVRKSVQQQHPEKNAKAITTLLGEEWRALSKKKKKKYEEQAEEDKIRHTNEMKAYKKKKQEESSESDTSSSSRSRSPPRKRKHKSKKEDSESDSRGGKKKRKESSEEESEKKNEEAEGDKKKKKAEGNQSKAKE